MNGRMEVYAGNEVWMLEGRMVSKWGGGIHVSEAADNE